LNEELKKRSRNDKKLRIEILKIGILRIAKRK